MSARWSPTSNKDRVLVRFRLDDMVLKIKKQKQKNQKQNSFQILVHIWIFFVFFFFLRVFSAFWGRVFAQRLRDIAPPRVGISVHKSVQPWVWTCCVGLSVCRLLPVSCFLCESGRSSARTRQGQSFGYVHIHGRSMASNSSSGGYFRRSSTHTDPSDALAPTLSPAAFQQTSKIPPVPL